ncbi:MAG: transporter [Pyrinomonadaceae bacterium]|nr:transporter [Pyrinomonadaceae bacterium]
MYNIQKAVSRLNYAPKLKEIEITDIKKGLGVFTPKPDKPVSFAALKETLKKAGYALDTADITVVGVLERDGKNWVLVSDMTKQRFSLAGENLAKVMADAALGTRVEVTGGWQTTGTGATAREVVSVETMKKAEDAPKVASFITSDVLPSPAMDASHARLKSVTTVAPAEMNSVVTKALAPIRTTSPGLTVYKGGAVTPRLYFIRQRLGGLEVNRQLLDLSLSYTPTPRLQLAVEVPVSRTAFDDGVNSGSGTGLGNITLWGKYRFFRKVKTYGDRQAAVRVGLELPTGQKSAPTEQEVNAPAFIRQQLTPISGGLSPHFDLAFSQAGGRFIFGGNVEGILRSERDGFRMGNEVRVNTDLEYVLLPREYQAPGNELFVILESTFVQKGRGRLNGAVVEGSKSTEFYLAPGLQYAADPQFVIEGSVQLPVIRNTGPMVLRNTVNVLLGMKYLF